MLLRGDVFTLLMKVLLTLSVLIHGEQVTTIEMDSTV